MVDLGTSHTHNCIKHWSTNRYFSFTYVACSSILFRPRTVIESDVPNSSVARTVVWIALGMSSREADRLRRRQVIQRIICTSRYISPIYRYRTFILLGSMVSPSQAQNFPVQQSGAAVKLGTTVADVVGGNVALRDEILRLALDPDDPPVLIQWNLASQEAFLDKAFTYTINVQGALPPPPMLAPAVVVQLPITAQAMEDFQNALLRHVCALYPGNAPSIIGGATGTVGLACSQMQSIVSGVILSRLEVTDQYLVAVLAHGNPLPGTLGQVLIPRPRNATGVCDLMPFMCTLWS